MKKRLFSLFFAFLLTFSAIPYALAANPDAMTDISGHWAEENIVWVMQEDLFNGVSDSQFNPDGTMTRGMFVTVLGRLANVDASAYQNQTGAYTDVRSGQYYAPYVSWATQKGIATGTGNGTFSPNANVTREQMAAFIVRFAKIYNYELLPITNEIVDRFTDESAISNYAKESVEVMRITGLINGIQNPDGSYAFSPKANASRAQCATVFRRLTQAISPPENESISPTKIQLSQTVLRLTLGKSAQLTATVSPANATNSPVTWVSSDPNVATVSSTGLVRYAGNGIANITASTTNGLSASCTVTCGTSYVASAADSYTTKCMGIFGEYTSNPRGVYATPAEAEAHMTTIGVKVWDFTDSSHTVKQTKTCYITVHENIAATVIQIFDEIYQCEEQYPISYVLGYGWRGSANSEHNVGLAIDINPVQNYYCYPDGTAITGTHFDPENDPYSMPVDGEIQKIFEKYGFTRGIYWRSGYKDYMHYSLFGT